MPAQRTAAWPGAATGAPQDVARLLAGLGRAGWHQVSRKDEAGRHVAALDRGGWRLWVVDVGPVRPGVRTDGLIVEAVRLGC